MGPFSCRKRNSGVPLIPQYGELWIIISLYMDNYLIIYYSIIIIEIKSIINVKLSNNL